MVAAGRSSDHDGNDVYLQSTGENDPGNAPFLAIPTLFLAGRHNRIFFPETSARTLRWLRNANPDTPYVRKELKEYAHLDTIIGRNAHHEVYPHILEHLDRY
jgi:cholesterol oxidase